MLSRVRNRRVGHALLGLLLLLGLAVDVVLSRCELDQGDWSRITIAVSQHDYFTALKDNGDCALEKETSLTKQYGDCTRPLREVAPADCDITLLSVIYAGAGQTRNDLMNRVAEYCSQTLGDFVKHRLCNPLRVLGCPSAMQIALFSPFANCHTPVLNLTDAQAAEFFATKQDLRCVKDTPEVCKQGKEWSDCPVRCEDVFIGLFPNGPWRCHTLLNGARERCAKPFREILNEVYCVPPSILEKNFLAIVLGCTLAPCLLGVITCVFCRMYRGDHISHKELLNQSMMQMGGSGEYPDGSRRVTHHSSMKSFHPEMHAAIAKYSKFKGVQFDQRLQQWTANGVVFTNEHEAAKAAYLQQAHVFAQKNMIQLNLMKNLQTSFDARVGGGELGSYSPPTFSAPSPYYPVSPPPGDSGSSGYAVGSFQLDPMGSMGSPPTSTASSMEFVGASATNAGVAPAEGYRPTPEQYKAQLVDFYMFWDPEKENIAEHVDNLFSRHNINHIKRAVQAKYGVCPPGWESL